MNQSLLICASCNCHVRAGEQWCPHCEADMAVAGSHRSMERRRIEIRRVLFTVVVAGAGIVSCDSPPDPRIVGSCAPNGSSQTLSCLTSCSCGDNGICDANGRCNSCGCSADIHQYCDAGGCSTRPCYGAPPVLA